MSNKTIIIGSRGSDLALWQANFVKGELEELGYDVEIIIIKTKGDRIQDLSFDKIEGKGFFTKELEACLLSNEIDLAVHSLKDLETTCPDGLQVVAVSERDSPNDVLLIKPESLESSSILSLKKGAIVATSSARRKAWLQELRPDLSIVDMRGNVPTRIGKLMDQNIDAIVLAEAGINRIKPNLFNLSKIVLEVHEFVPAPAQGVLGLQIRSNDTELASVLKRIGSSATYDIVKIERGVLSGIGGGCHVPLGAFCTQLDSGDYELIVAYKDEFGFRKVKLKGRDNLVKDALEALKKKSSSHAN